MRIFFIALLLQISTALVGQDGIAIAPGANDLHRYSLFLLGEFHDRGAENEAAFLRLAKHLYQHNNVRYLVFEWGPDFSYLTNRYLQTQVDSLLFKNTLELSRAFWDTLVELIRGKLTADRIKIGGFDFNRSVFTGKAFYIMMRGKASFPDQTIQTAIEEIIKWKDIKWSWEAQSEFVGQMKKLRSLSESQVPALKSYFGEDAASFFSIINHDVESTPMVKRDQNSIGYVKAFLEKKEGNVLFKLGVNHTYFDHAGMGRLLQQDKQYQNKVCSIYPYHLIPGTEKTKFQQDQDEILSSSLVTKLQSAKAYSLVNLTTDAPESKMSKKVQWVYVIPKVNP